MSDVRDLYEGCLLGLAVGDALGAPVEFLSLDEIKERFDGGVVNFAPWENGCGVKLPPGSYTDDTQMALATAEGCLDAVADWTRTGLMDTDEAVWRRYRAWLEEQKEPRESRFPGATCLSAVRGGEPGSVDEPLNESKGNGSVMRIAPVGLAFVPGAAFEQGAAVGALTHGHPSGFLAAGFFAEVVSQVVRGMPLMEAIAETRELLLGWDEYDETLEAVDMAVESTVGGVDIEEAVRAIGGGWTAEEALGIALLCVLWYPDSWAEATLAAVNIDGDSDTTGALAGGLAGAKLGLSRIPPHLADNVEDSDRILDLADEMYEAFIENAKVRRR